MNHINENKDMPYFIKASENFTNEEKEIAYQKIERELNILLEEEDNTILKMSTINCLLKTNLNYAYWVGFYCVNGNKLSVGPYQGTLGCIHIGFGKGVCGEVAVSKKTKIVKDVTILEEGEDHITCDFNSQSEIVVPVFDTENSLIAVLDIDSTLKDSFNEIDQVYLEKIMRNQFSTE